MTAAQATDLRVEHHDEPFGIGETAPRISWHVVEGEQGGYEVEIERDSAEGAQLSGRIVDTDSRWIAWPFEPLASREHARIRVRLWNDNADEAGEWSPALELEAGLINRSDWTARLVSPSLSAPTGGPRPAYLLRADFTLDEAVDRARVYVTAQGSYRLFVNGHAVSDDVLAPGWTSYSSRLRYRTIDVTAFLREGENTIGAQLADGWFRGRLGFNGGVWDNYGSHVALLAQVETYGASGQRSTVDLDGRWRWAPSEIIATGLYEGETVDARLVTTGWCEPGLADTSAWSAVESLPVSSVTAELVAPTGPPVRVTDEREAVAIDRRPNGNILLDFGQNFAGKLRVRPRGREGHTIVIRHSEVLEEGELSTRPLRSAPSVDTLVLAGTGQIEEWTPTFTLHGFRYAEIENWPGEFTAADAVALVVHTDMRRTGWLETSNPLLNRLHENVVWSMRSNFVDLPTDCPQRDERLGWTGDIQVFADTASYLYQSAGLLVGWLRDVAAEQKQYGTVPNFVPWIECGFSREPTAAWGDVAVILPWKLYQRTGDVGVLRDQYESAAAWVDQVAARTNKTGLWNTGFQLGDWLDPTAPPDRPDLSRTDRNLVATGYHAHTARLLSRIAAILGNADDAEKYDAIAGRARAAFQREFVAPSGRLVSDTETSISLAIEFDLLTPQQRMRAGARLVELVEDSDFTIRTGFVGTPLICDALASVGEHDTAYKLLTQTAFPSWLYPVTMGATTIWERWDSMLPDGTVNPGEMTSFNHYALGAVADYMHRLIGGIAPRVPGYREVTIAPVPGGGLTSADARCETPYGEVAVSWLREDTAFSLTAVVPPGARAWVTLPGSAVPSIVGAGTHRFIGEWRSPEDDPKRTRRVNLHNPAERMDVAVS